jgi:hypothetical protein
MQGAFSEKRHVFCESLTVVLIIYVLVLAPVSAVCGGGVMMIRVAYNYTADVRSFFWLRSSHASAYLRYLVPCTHSYAR